jgi:hypothetical protein
MQSSEKRLIVVCFRPGGLNSWLHEQVAEVNARGPETSFPIEH